MNDASSYHKQIREDKHGSRKTKYKTQVKVSLMNFWHLRSRTFNSVIMIAPQPLLGIHLGGQASCWLIQVTCWWSGSVTGSHSVQNLSNQAGFLFMGGICYAFSDMWWNYSSLSSVNNYVTVKDWPKSYGTGMEPQRKCMFCWSWKSSLKGSEHSLSWNWAIGHRLTYFPSLEWTLCPWSLSHSCFSRT